jgi:hypothetical protein
MKAITQDRYGSAEVLRLRDIEEPTPGDHEVLVRVQAAGIARGVLHVMTGEPYLMRLVGFGLLRPKNPGPETGAELRAEKGGLVMHGEQSPGNGDHHPVVIGCGEVLA